MERKISFKVIIELIHSDLKFYGKRTGFWGLYRMVTSPSFRITFWYRLGIYFINCDSTIFKILFLPIVTLFHIHNQYLTGIQMPFKVECGRCLHFPHFSSIIISPNTKIGNNCRIYQCVTIGSTRGRRGGVLLGNNVILFSGAKIIGNVKMAITSLLVLTV